MEEALKKALKDYAELADPIHFENGWRMWPEWWASSTISWQLGFNARKDYEDNVYK